MKIRLTILVLFSVLTTMSPRKNIDIGYSTAREDATILIEIKDTETLDKARNRFEKLNDYSEIIKNNIGEKNTTILGVYLDFENTGDSKTYCVKIMSDSTNYYMILTYLEGYLVSVKIM